VKLLVIRMSSLGDVILSTAFLESLPKNVQIDWVISKEFAFVLKGHPKIRTLIEFDKRKGLIGWFDLIRELSHHDYDMRVDLHVTLRSLLARIYFHWLDFSRGYWVPWKSISKQRFQFYGYLIFKKWWPEFFRPHPLHERFSHLACKLSGLSTDQASKPAMGHLELNGPEALKKYSLESKKFFVVMPSSRWASKEWSTDSYERLCVEYSREKSLVPVVLGRLSDRNAAALVFRFHKNGIVHRAVLSESEFSITASLIKEAAFYVGSDTGLAHLAEAVGTPATMIFGPTRPDLGFGPWRKDSQSVYSSVGCSPCSKDGKICYRFKDRYACLKQITVEQVKDHLP
jgi:ADP-heptose:LPS heptosyltransferase